MSLSMMQFRPSIEPTTFMTTSGCTTCYATAIINNEVYAEENAHLIIAVINYAGVNAHPIVAIMNYAEVNAHPLVAIINYAGVNAHPLVAIINYA